MSSVTYNTSPALLGEVVASWCGWQGSRFQLHHMHTAWLFHLYEGSPLAETRNFPAHKYNQLPEKALDTVHKCVLRGGPVWEGGFSEPCQEKLALQP